MREVNVTLEVNPVSIKLEVPENYTDKEILELAKKEYIKEISKKFPRVGYQISDGNTLSFDNVYLGQIVMDRNRYGIVTKINKKTINVATQSGIFQGPPSCFGVVEDKVKPESVLWERTKGAKELDLWIEGNVGYLALKQDNKVVPVVIGKTTSAGNYHLYLVGKNTNKYYRLTQAQIKQFLFDTKKEANAFLKK